MTIIETPRGSLFPLTWLIIQGAEINIF